MQALYGGLLRKFWWLLLAVTLALTAAAALHLRRIGIEFQTRTLLDQKDEAFRQFEQKHETGTWSATEFAVVSLERGEWITPEGVALLREVVSEIRELPHTGATLSPLNIPLLRQNPGQRPNLFTLAGGTRYLRQPEQIHWEAAREEILQHELAVGTLISADGRQANILVYLEPGGASGDEIQRRWQETVRQLRERAQAWEQRLQAPVRLAGVPVVYTYIMERVEHDLRVFGIAAALLFTSGLFFVYRRVVFVILPLLTSLVPVVLILGLMGMGDLRITVITSNLPLLLFVISLPYTIYLTELYLERRAAAPQEKALDSIVQAASALSAPIIFSSLTTAAGFLAFATSGIVPVRQFGLLMAAGAAVAVAAVFLFHAPLLRGWMAGRAAVGRPERSAAAVAATGRTRARLSLAGRFGRLAQRWPRSVLVASALLLAASVAGAVRLTAENKFTSYFWPTSEVYRDIEFIDRNLGGTSTLEIYLTSPQEGFFKTPAGLKAVAAVERFFGDVPETGSVRSLNSLVREARKTFRAEWFPDMEDATLLNLVQTTAPELFQDIMSADATEASVQVRMRETAPTLNRRAILNALNRHLDNALGGPLQGLRVETTGIFVLYANMLETLLQSQRETLGFVAVAVFLMLLLLFRSPLLALVVLLPQALPALTILGLMGWLGIPLDLVTVMIAAIAIGIGIDSAIQFTMRYRRELQVDGDRAEALSRTHATVGRAIWIATSIIVAGFGVLVFSDFFPSVWFGLFTGLAMLMSQFSALVALPALFLVTGLPAPPARARTYHVS